MPVLLQPVADPDGLVEHGDPDRTHLPYPHWSGVSRGPRARRATKGPMRPATEKDRRRYAIPPAYTSVMVATDPKAELRATAVDAQGRVHSYYSASYRNRQERAKWARVAAMQRAMPDLQRRVARDVARGVPQALTVSLIMQTGLRNGGDGSTKGEPTYGASNLLVEHVTVQGDTLRLQFRGKSGVRQDHVVTDPALAAYARQRREAGATRLFPHTANDTYLYLQRVGKGRFKVHDIRTWRATVEADRMASTLVEAGLQPTTKKAFKAFRKQIGERVAKLLGDTVSTTLNTYIHPAVLQPWEVT